MRLLMHICCANCGLYPIRTLEKRGIEIKAFWYNPNIHPFTEYDSRLKSVKILEEKWGLDVEYADDYGLTDFVRNVVNNEGSRCEYCYTVRLERTAKRASESGLDAFTTSLLVSPYQKTDMIMDKGKALSEQYNIEFLAEDFRPGFREGMRMSKELELYRQKYCGCIYSEMERYLGKKQWKALR